MATASIPLAAVTSLNVKVTEWTVEAKAILYNKNGNLKSGASSVDGDLVTHLKGFRIAL